MPRLIGFLLTTFAFAANLAHAHPLDLGLAQLESRGAELSVSLDVNPSVAASLLALDATNLGTLAVQGHAEDLVARTLNSGALTRGEKPCSWRNSSAEINPQTVKIVSTALCESSTGRYRWSMPFVAGDRVPRTFQVVLKVGRGSGEAVHFVERGKETIDFEISEADPHHFGEFIWMGVEHIGAAPSEWRGADGWHLPEGLDHILFLLALVLGGGTFLQLLAIVTGFTAGHSVSLVLASLKIVQLPSQAVESAIAFSIAFVACETMLGFQSKHRWKVAAVFGLVHGFGFASALTELQLAPGSLALALLGFNAGVELGQVILLAALAPFLLWLRRQGYVERFAMRASSAAIFAAGSYWFVVRAFGLA